MTSRAMPRRGTALLVMALTGFSGACDRTGPDPMVVRALTCEECSAGELDSVVARGNAAIPALVRAVAGPPIRVESATVARIRAGLLQFDTANVAFGGVVGEVERTRQRLRDSWERRAILLLARIGTPAARHALVAAASAIPVNRRFAVTPRAGRMADSLVRAWPAVASPGGPP